MALICLQGGNEFSAQCRDMDALLLAAAGGGPVAVLPLASRPGREYDTTAAHAVAYYTSLGATAVTVGEPVGDARLIVLPGGSPARLRDALLGTPVAAALEDASRADDRVISGASAGAMLLCAHTVLPEDGLTAATGLGLVGDFAVVPHYDRARPGWERVLLDRGVDVLGIPECSGVLLDGEEVVAVGARATTLVTSEGREQLSL